LLFKESSGQFLPEDFFGLALDGRDVELFQPQRFNAAAFGLQQAETG
jgi:hypothetical protein